MAGIDRMPPISHGSSRSLTVMGVAVLAAAEPTEVICSSLLARLFHDEELDGTWDDRSVRHLGMVLGADEDFVRPAAGPLTDLEWVSDRGRDTVGDVPAPFSGRVAALMARTEIAAAYLLVGGL